MRTTNFIFTIFCCVVSLSALSDKYVQGDAEVGIIKATDTCSTNHKVTNRKAKGCIYNGKFIPNGTTVQDTSCKSCTCDSGRIVCAVKKCARLPPSCSYVRTATECCKLICKKGCVYNGIFIPEGATSIVAPCTYGSCNGGKVYIAIADCAKPPEGCHYESTMSECCNLVCDKGCTYNGIFIPEGATSIVAPCTYGSCNGGKVFIAIADCAKPPEGCHYESTMEQCCNLICDEGCLYFGHFIANGATLKISSCESCTCNNGQASCTLQDCTPPPPGCSYVRTDTECCKMICDDDPLTPTL